MLAGVIKYENEGVDKLKLTTFCPACEKTGTVIVYKEDMESYREGRKLIQVAFPNLSADEREMLLTGYHAECWSKISFDDGEEVFEDD